MNKKEIETAYTDIIDKLVTEIVNSGLSTDRSYHRLTSYTIKKRLEKSGLALVGIGEQSFPMLSSIYQGFMEKCRINLPHIIMDLRDSSKKKLFDIIISGLRTSLISEHIYNLENKLLIFLSPSNRITQEELKLINRIRNSAYNGKQTDMKLVVLVKFPSGNDYFHPDIYSKESNPDDSMPEAKFNSNGELVLKLDRYYCLSHEYGKVKGFIDIVWSAVTAYITETRELLKQKRKEEKSEKQYTSGLKDYEALNLYENRKKIFRSIKRLCILELLLDYSDQWLNADSVSKQLNFKYEFVDKQLGLFKELGVIISKKYNPGYYTLAPEYVPVLESILDYINMEIARNEAQNKSRTRSKA